MFHFIIYSFNCDWIYNLTLSSVKLLLHRNNSFKFLTHWFNTLHEDAPTHTTFLVYLFGGSAVSRLLLVTCFLGLNYLPLRPGISTVPDNSISLPSRHSIIAFWYDILISYFDEFNFWSSFQQIIHAFRTQSKTLLIIFIFKFILIIKSLFCFPQAALSDSSHPLLNSALGMSAMGHEMKHSPPSPGNPCTFGDMLRAASHLGQANEHHQLNQVSVICFISF